MTVAWTRGVGLVGEWFSATVVQETCCAIETGKPLCPSDRQVLIAQSLPCLLAILAAICRRAAMQPMLEPLVELMYGTPCAIAIAKAPRAGGSCVFFFRVCGVVVVCRRTLLLIVTIGCVQLL